MRRVIDGLTELTTTAIGGFSLVEFLLQALAAGALFYGVWFYKRTRATNRLDAIERGERCLRCEADVVERAGDAVRCGACGYATTLGALRTHRVTAAELGALTRPDLGDD